MKRTMRRPLPCGRVSPTHAAIWATSAGIAGTTLLASKFLAYSSYSTYMYSLLPFQIY
jgi:heme O synthase-like polyprenyltransferase